MSKKMDYVARCRAVNSNRRAKPDCFVSKSTGKTFVNEAIRASELWSAFEQLLIENDRLRIALANEKDKDAEIARMRPLFDAAVASWRHARMSKRAWTSEWLDRGRELRAKVEREMDMAARSIGAQGGVR